MFNASIQRQWYISIWNYAMSFSSISSDSIPFLSWRSRMLQDLLVSGLTFYSAGETEKVLMCVTPKWSQFIQQLYLKDLVYSTNLCFVGGTLHWSHIYAHNSITSIPTIRQNNKYDFVWSRFKHGRTTICCFNTVLLEAPLPFFLYCRERKR